MPGKESATVVWFRALVLLACLVLVPAAAIIGSAFPDVVKSALVNRLSRLADAWRGKAIKESAEEDAGTETAAALDRRAPAFAQGSLPTASIRGPGEYGGSGSHEYGRARQADDGRSGGNRRVAPAGYLEPENYAAAQGQAPGTSLPSADRFEAIERRLRQAGATYYLLETYGAGQYRFHCQAAIARGGHPRHFEAVDRDPVAAMTRIAEDLENWRTADARN